MKTTLQSVTTGLLLFVTTILLAAGPDFGPTETLRKEVAKIVHSPELMKHGINEAIANIQFTVNEKNEVQVLDIETSYPFLEAFIEQRLTNRKLNTEGLTPNTVYTLAVLFQTEE